MLTHHSSEDYNVAASEAAKKARNKMEGLFNAGRSRAEGAIKALQDNQPADYIVLGKSMNFAPLGRGINLMFQDKPRDLHSHALQQISEKAGVPKKFADTLISGEDWGRNLLAHNFNEIYRNQNGERYLVREVNGEVRGFLSDKYRRMDSGPIVEAFVKTTTQFGAVPVDSRCLETQFFMKMMLPYVFEPIPNEVMALGIILRNSDYGDGALSISTFIMRLWCTNTAIAENALRKVHLGGRLGDDLALSQRTYDLDTKVLASATEDIVNGIFAPDSVHIRMAAIKTAHEKPVDAKDALNTLQKAARITKAELEGISDTYNRPDIELLPPGNTAWRLSNALSLFAQSAEPKRALELETMAGEVIGLNKD